MITVANRIFVDPQQAAEFEERFLRRPRVVDGFPGFIANHLLRPTKGGDPYVVLVFWESREAFENWKAAPGFRDGHKGGQTLGPGAVLSNVIEIHEVFSGSAQPEENAEEKGAGQG